MKPENWIKWDLDSRSGLHMGSYFRQTGAVGYGFFMLLIETLYREKEHKIELTSIPLLAEQFRLEVDQVVGLLDILFECKLMQKDAKVFWSPRVLEEVQNRTAHKHGIALKRADAANKRWSQKLEKTKEVMQTDANVCNGMQRHARGEERRLDKKRSESNTPAPIPPDVHASPSAPKNLRRKKFELKPRGTLNAVWLTDKEYQTLCEEFSAFETEHLIDNLEDYSTMNPAKFKKYTDHYRVLLTFRQNSIEKGKTFRIHPTTGPGYYFNRDFPTQNASFRK